MVASFALILTLPALAAAQPPKGVSAEADLSVSSDTVAGEEVAAPPAAASPTSQKIRPMPVVDTGPQAGFRTGFALVSGKGTGPKDNMSEVITGYVPLWLDLGYRVIPSLFIGAYGQAGFVFLKQGDTCKGSDASCTGQDYRLGLELAYHFNDDGQFDPWIGIGAGYEWLKLNVRYEDTYLGSFNTTVRGFELVNVQLGLDIKPTRQGGVGPFIALAMAQYDHYKVAHVTREAVAADAGSVPSPQTHQWIIFGIQGSYFDDL